MDIETLQLTQEDIERQNKDYHEDYLAEAKAGDWVYDDGEVLCSQSCVERWRNTSTTEKETEKQDLIFKHLEKLNKQ